LVIIIVGEIITMSYHLYNKDDHDIFAVQLNNALSWSDLKHLLTLVFYDDPSKNISGSRDISWFARPPLQYYNYMQKVTINERYMYWTGKPYYDPDTLVPSEESSDY